MFKILKIQRRIAEFKQILKRGRKFTKEAYLSDVYMVGTMYASEALKELEEV